MRGTVGSLCARTVDRTAFNRCPYSWSWSCRSSYRSSCFATAESRSPFPSTSFASEATTWATATSSSSTVCGNIATEKQTYRSSFATKSIAATPFSSFGVPVSTTPIVPIYARAFSVLSSNNTPAHQQHQDEKDNDLRRKTQEWLKIPVSTWTRKDVSRGRFLIREWSEINNTATSSDKNSNSNCEERAIQQTQILRRWMKERRTAVGDDRLNSIFESSQRRGNNNNNTNTNTNNPDSREMVEMLNRCLDSWRKAAASAPQQPLLLPTTTTTGSATATATATPQSESMGLIRLFCEASESLNDKELRPNRKTYSMCMNVLSLFPESSTVCGDVLSLLHQCLETTTPDLQFYNVCLHTLAKCATHHPEAPILVEKVLRENIMTSSSSSSSASSNSYSLSPNTTCFVSVLHAWANSIPLTAAAATKGHWHHRGSESTNVSAAERAEAILNQMIRDYPQLVDTICFNICIDAWGKQGHPEKAEAILRRLYQYQRRRSDSENENEDDASRRRRKTAVVIRPNQISFNSAINAWSKSARFGRNSGGNDDYPKKAADRAGRLWQQMKAQGLEPTQETFGSLMEAYSKTSNPGIRVQSFLDELEKMYSDGELSRPPPKICYLMAIRAWGRTKHGGAENAEALVQRLEDTCEKEGGDWSELEPCTILYTALVSAWAESDAGSAPDRAWKLYREMGQKAKLSGQMNGVAPNAITLNAVLRAFCNHDRIDEARELLTKQHAVRPDSKSYLTILKAYANSNASDAAEKAQELLMELEDNYRHREEGTMTIKPTVRMYSQLLVAWGNSPKIDAAFRAEKLFWQLQRQEEHDNDDDYDSIGLGMGVLPDTATFNCVLRAWSKSFEGGSAERAEAFLQKVQNEPSHSGDISIDPISHLHLIYAWAHSRRRKAPKEAERHLEQARALCRQSGKRLTRAHFNSTILAWKKSDDRNAARRIQKLQDERDSTTRP